jgi:hypothetical protein
MSNWEASSEIIELLNKVKLKNHHPRLEMANIAVCFSDAKAFTKDRFNWGKVQKISSIAKLFHPENKKYDFYINISGDLWHSHLSMTQREALLDLHLCRCDVEYEPETSIDPVTKKKVKVKDESGRVVYSNVVKVDEDGLPKWRVHPLDLEVFSENISRYGAWHEELVLLKDTIMKIEDKEKNVVENVVLEFA